MIPMIRCRIVASMVGALLFTATVPAVGDDAAPGSPLLEGPSESVEPVEQPPVSETTDPLLKQVQEVISISSRRVLTADVHTPWQILHGVLALGRDFNLKRPGSDETIPAVDWLADRATYRGEPLFEVTPFGGRAHPFTQPYAFEGHPSQFLAIMSMSLPLDFQLETRTGTITIAQMVENAKKEANTSEEMTWTLWALSRYVEPDAQWLNKHNEPWSMERLVRIETQHRLQSAPCGGTHGMFALSNARNSYYQTYGRVTGAWLEADQKIKQHIEIARTMQNRDGSFSAKYFERPVQSNDYLERLATTGHMLEWLMIGLPQDRLNEPWVRNAVGALSKDMLDNRMVPVDTGPLYHALDAMVLYRMRMQPNFGKPAPAPAPVEKTAAAPVATEPKPEAVKAAVPEVAETPEPASTN